MIRREKGLSKTVALMSGEGRPFDYAAPTPEMVHLPDVIESLSKTPRFLGMCGPVYSVAEHSVLVMQVTGVLWLESQGNPAPSAVLWAALMHDAHEAYTGDLPSPAKRAFPAWETFSAPIRQAVRTALKVGELPPVVHAADHVAYELERIYLYGWTDVEIESDKIDQAVTDARILTPGQTCGGGAWKAAEIFRKAIKSLPVGAALCTAHGVK